MSERLRVSDLRGSDRILEIEEQGELVEYPVPGGTSVELISFMLQLETRMDSGEDSEVVTASEEAVDLIWEQIKVRTPEAPRPRLTIEETMGVLAFIAGGDSVSGVVVEALTNPGENGDVKPSPSAEALKEADPLESGASRSRSKKSSPKRSSGSGSGTSGPRTGRAKRRSGTSARS